MKTPIDEIEEHVADLRQNYDFNFYKFFEKVKQLKVTERKLIIDLCTEAYELGLGHKEYSAEETYNENFNS